uniref:DDE Tnp4 domain-containing protein n=1 Tax=Sander lucioperca TaxID=283035 RepID=A0A8D0D999_SANLU
MSAQRFNDVPRRIKPFFHHKRTHLNPVSLQERLAVTLRVLPSGTSQNAVAISYKLLCAAIWRGLRDDFVPFPQGAEWKEFSRDFWRMWNFPNCLGCVDGKHVTIKAPANARSDYFNYKGANSIVLMAVCDARYRFTMVDIGAFGRESDGGIFQSSEFGTVCTLARDQHQPAPCFTVIETSAGVNLDDARKIYNYCHSRARRVIKNSCGILAARWRIFQKPMEFSPDKVVDVVKACVALHNMLTHRCCTSSNLTSTFFLTQQGLVPWQETVIRRGCLN